MGRRYKKYRRRSTSAGLYIPIAVLLVFFSAAFGTSAFLKIETIEVIGASKYTEEEIISVAAIEPGDNMLLVDTNRAGRRITDVKPYVSDARVIRGFPDTIRIEIRESVAIAVINAQGSVLMIDSAGRILERTAEAPEGMITINGITPQNPEIGSPISVESSAEARLIYMSEVLTAIEKSGIISRVSYLDVSNIANISFTYDGRFRVVLGGADDVGYKLSRMEDVIGGIPQSDVAVGTIDVSEQGKTLWTPE